MANPNMTPPGIQQGDIGSRSIRKRLADEMYLAKYVKAGDRLRVQAFLSTGVAAAVTTANLTIGGRVQGMDGELVSLSDAYSFTADGAQTARFLMMPEGYLTHFIALTTTTGLAVGDMAVHVDLVQGVDTTFTPIDLIAAGWVAFLASLGLNTPQVTV
jgi:hypothetical protein